MRTIFNIVWCLSLAAALLLVAPGQGYSQVDQSGFLSMTPRGTTTNYHFAEPNELTIVVSLLGAVQRPGRYEISRTIDLPNLLSLAGGTLPGADMGDIRIMRTMRGGSRIERKEISVNLKDMMKNAEADLQLNQGDFVVVDHTSWATVNDVLTVLTTTAVITTAVVSVVNLSRK